MSSTPEFFDSVRFESEYFLRPRIANKQRIAAIIRSSDGVARSDIVAQTNLSKSIVASLVAELIEQGLTVEENGTGQGARAGVLRATLPDVPVVAIRFDHREVTVAVADLAFNISGERSVPIALDDTPDAVFGSASKLYQSTLGALSIDPESVEAVAVAIPGPISRFDGAAVGPSVLSTWPDINPARELSQRLGRSVYVDNDANLGAWGELTLGAGAPFSDALYIEASRGIGVGLILGRQVYRGADGLAGELGHTQVDQMGPLCRCGQHGCVEVVAGASAVLGKLQSIRGQSSGDLPLSAFADDVSTRIIREAGYAVGRVVADACNLLNPEAIIVGGEIGQSSHYLDGVREAIRRFAQPVVSQRVVTIAGAFGDRSVLMGALVRARALALSHEIELEQSGRSLPRNSSQPLICDLSQFRAARA